MDERGAVTEFAICDFVMGLRSMTFHFSDGFYMALALRMQDGRLLVALDADFAFDLRDAISRVVRQGGFDIGQRVSAREAAFQCSEFEKHTAEIPESAFFEDMHAAVAHERGVNLVESTAIELDLVLASDWSGTVWFDEVGAHALAKAVQDCEEGGMQRP